MDHFFPLIVLELMGGNNGYDVSRVLYVAYVPVYKETKLLTLSFWSKEKLVLASLCL
jgi:hypothetical protein